VSADHSEVELIQKRLENAVREIRTMTAMVGHAKQVKDYDSDRRKTLLAQCMLPYLKAGHSAASAEMEARADPRYELELNLLMHQREAAERTIAKWDAAFCTYEAARSLLSMAKTTLSTLD
jgi:hypothetical protein